MSRVCKFFFLFTGIGEGEGEPLRALFTKGVTLTLAGGVPTSLVDDDNTETFLFTTFTGVDGVVKEVEVWFFSTRLTLDDLSMGVAEVDVEMGFVSFPTFVDLFICGCD